jgi:hypothetical protein
MSIPLDRLYDFLGSINCYNLLIYGWRVHGSKNLEDFNRRNPFPTNWKERKTQPLLIFHDQEPLDYDWYQYQIDCNFCNLVKDWSSFLLMSAPLIQEFCKASHLKSLLEITFYDLTLLVHSEQNSHQVEKYKQNNFVPVYYWSHAAISRDWFRFAEHDYTLKFKTSAPKTFLIYNRAWSGTREYRLKFTEQLIAANLHHNCITSFAEFDNQVHYQNHVFSNPAFKIECQNLERVLTKNTYDSNASADYNNHDYQNSLIEVVLETLFDDTRNHLTEKSLRPIACGQPFILVSTPGSLEYLRSYGFQTFDGYIDETYDTIQDPVERLNAIIQEMQRINQFSANQKQQLISEIKSTVEYNQKLFFSQEFHSRIVDEFEQNLNNAVAAVKAGPVGNNWKQFRSIAQEHYPELFLKYLHLDCDDLAWAEQWIQSHVKS